MANLIKFYDEGHIYEVDGETVPSVSEVTRFLSREVYGDITQFRLDSAAERGTSVHKALEVLDKYGEVEITEDIVPYINAYFTFRHEHKVKWLYIEKPVCDANKRYAGTLDRYGEVDGLPCILDIKTCAAVDPLHRTMYTAAQNLYRMAVNQPVVKLLILHLKKDGSYKLWELPIDNDLANACLLLHERTKRRQRKRKEVTNGRNPAEPADGTSGTSAE